MKNFSLYTLILLTLACFSTKLLGTHTTADLSKRFEEPSPAHILGYDELGRDLLLRILDGGQISLSVGIITALLAALIGLSIGLVAGYYGGKIDAFLMRLTDFLIALPLLPLLIILSSIDMNKLGFTDTHDSSGLFKIIALMVFAGWTGVARLVRARTLTIKEMPFVLAAKALGVGDAAILRHHILPNVQDTVIVAATLAAGQFILMESVLSFLGLGISPPMASWGNMLTNAEENIWENAQLALYPGVMIFVTVLCFNFLGDRLQRKLDTKRT